jgi:hypothetical protein
MWFCGAAPFSQGSGHFCVIQVAQEAFGHGLLPQLPVCHSQFLRLMRPFVRMVLHCFPGAITNPWQQLAAIGSGDVCQGWLVG